LPGETKSHGATGLGSHAWLAHKKIHVRGDIAVHRLGRQRTANLVHALHESLVIKPEWEIEDRRFPGAIEDVGKKHRVAFRRETAGHPPACIADSEDIGQIEDT
jgi:hypothetical protein